MLLLPKYALPFFPYSVSLLVMFRLKALPNIYIFVTIVYPVSCVLKSDVCVRACVCLCVCHVNRVCSFMYLPASTFLRQGANNSRNSIFSITEEFPWIIRNRSTVHFFLWSSSTRKNKSNLNNSMFFHRKDNDFSNSSQLLISSNAEF